VKWVKFSGIAWEGDGFYYSRYPEPAKGDALKGRSTFQKVYFHRVGTPQSNDVLIHEDPQNPNRGFGCATTKDERFVCITPWETTSGNALLVWDKKSDKDLGLVSIISDMEKDFHVIDNNGDWLLLQTNYKAPNTRIIAVNINQHDEANWKEIVPESKDVLQNSRIVGGKLILTYLHNASSLVKIYSLEGKFIADLKLPDVGTVGGFSGNQDDNEAFFSFSSFTRPNTIYSLDIKTLSNQVFKAPKIDFEVDKYETKQVWYTSKDGTKVPMFIVHKKGLVLNGKNPTLLYGYGGFNISMLPGFALTRTLLLENGGVYAVANLRGGGEFGEEWHKAGTKERKQNVFNDFIAAAEYLIAKNYCTKEYLAIEGGSNGGLLVGACMTQRPDLYRVAFPRVGVLDMLRYHKFTIGRAWAVDYGLSENAKEFESLIKYSPLHNVRASSYPSTMVMTADHDDRVVPAHSFKFIAELQAKHTGTNPTLIRIETAAGHGAGKPTGKMIEEAVDALAFMFNEMGITLK
jgi:prolyl oligopeptidase